MTTVHSPGINPSGCGNSDPTGRAVSRRCHQFGEAAESSRSTEPFTFVPPHSGSSLPTSGKTASDGTSIKFKRPSKRRHGGRRRRERKYRKLFHSLAYHGPQTPYLGISLSQIQHEEQAERDRANQQELEALKPKKKISLEEYRARQGKVNPETTQKTVEPSTLEVSNRPRPRVISNVPFYGRIRILPSIVTLD